MIEIAKKILGFIRQNLNIFFRTFLKNPPYDYKMHKFLLSTDDPIRYTTIALAIHNIKEKKISGNFAEVGVYRGNTSKIIHALAPKTLLYLFDTFEGFTIKLSQNADKRFKDTTIDILKKNMGDLNNVKIVKGLFPDTVRGLENECFSLVMIDHDKYKPTLLELNFFYQKVFPGGYIFIHDYNNPFESNAEVHNAVNEFMKDKIEKIVQIPDKWGSIIIRKIYAN